MEGSYFNIGGASRPEDVEFYDVRGNKRGGTSAEIESIRDIFSKRGGGGGGEDEGGDGMGGGGGIGTGGTGILGGIEGLLGEGLSGKFSRYGDDTMSRLRGQALEQNKRGLGQEQQSIAAEAQRQGLGGAAVAALSQKSRIGAREDLSGSMRDLANQKAIADYEDKKSALQDAMAYVNQTREYELGKAKNQNDRDRIESEAAVARERIASESSMLDRQLEAQREMAASSARSAASGQRSSQQFNREMAELRHSWDLENRDFMMPLQLAQLAL